MAASLPSRAARSTRVTPHIEHLAWSVPIWLNVGPPGGQLGGQIGHQLAVDRDESATVAGWVGDPVGGALPSAVILTHCRHLGGWRGAVWRPQSRSAITNHRGPGRPLWRLGLRSLLPVLPPGWCVREAFHCSMARRLYRMFRSKLA